MNTLSFRVSREGPMTDANTVNVEVLIDGASPSGSLVDVTGVIFGGEMERSSFYVYTCSCGHAGCEGFHIPLDQCREGDTVVWTIEDEKLAEVFGAERLAFDAAAFDAAREALRTELTALEAEGLFAGSQIDFDYDDDLNQTLVGRTLEESATHARPYYAAQQAMKDAVAAAGDPDDPAPVQFAFDVEHLDRTYEMPAAEVAARLLNLGDSIRPGEEERVAVLSGLASIVRVFANDKDADAAELAYTPYRRFLRDDELEEAGTVAFRIHEGAPLVVFPAR